MMVRHLVFLVIALVLGYSLTLIFIKVGGVFVQPAVFLAKLVVVDRGNSLLLPFTYINTLLCAGIIYVALCLVTGRSRGSKP